MEPITDRCVIKVGLENVKLDAEIHLNIIDQENGSPYSTALGSIERIKERISTRLDTFIAVMEKAKEYRREE